SNDHHKLEQVRSSPKFENLFINIEYDQIKLCDFGDSICLSNMKYVRRMSGNIPIYYKTDICTMFHVIIANYVQSQTELILSPLRYEYNALEPLLSEHLMQLHHDKYHQTLMLHLNLNLLMKHLMID
ncbi:unnamed protein product, partial [Rotaria sp. Silwood1]